MLRNLPVTHRSCQPILEKYFLPISPGLHWSPASQILMRRRGERVEQWEVTVQLSTVSKRKTSQVLRHFISDGSWRPENLTPLPRWIPLKQANPQLDVAVTLISSANYGKKIKTCISLAQHPNFPKVAVAHWAVTALFKFLKESMLICARMKDSLPNIFQWI